MPVEEQFNAKQGTVLGVQIRPISGITTVTITAITMFLNNVSAERNAEVDITIDGLTYRFRVEFVDETLESRTITGGIKPRIPEGTGG